MILLSLELILPTKSLPFTGAKLALSIVIQNNKAINIVDKY